MNVVKIVVPGNEINLKSNQVRKRFMDNLKRHIRDFSPESKLEKIYGGRLIFDDLAEKVRFIPGIEKIISAYHVKLGEELEVFDKIFASYDFNSFSLKVKREGQHTFRSIDYAKSIAQTLEKRFGKEAKLKEAELTIFVEIRQDDVYIYTERDVVPGLGGLPFGSLGNVLILYEDDFSPFRGFLAIRRGLTPVFLDKDKEYFKSLFKMFPSYFKLPDQTDYVFTISTALSRFSVDPLAFLPQELFERYFNIYRELIA